MNFTKQYIELCKNDKVQELRKEIQADDWIYADFSKTYHFVYMADIPNSQRDKVYWLPTGDQLDEEITKILAEMSKNGEDLSYDIGVSFMDGNISAWQVTVSNRDYEHTEMEVDLNLAKLKLLVALLENKYQNLYPEREGEK